MKNAYSRLNKPAKSGITLEIVSLLRKNPGIFFSSEYIAEVLEGKGQTHREIFPLDVDAVYGRGYIARVNISKLKAVFEFDYKKISSLVWTKEVDVNSSRIFLPPEKTISSRDLDRFLFLSPRESEISKILNLVEAGCFQELEKFLVEEYLLKKPRLRVTAELRKADIYQ